MTIPVVLADDQAMVRHGLRLILNSQPDIEVVAEAADGLQALAAVRRYTPEVALIDVRMPELDGIEATRQLLSGAEPVATRVVILTTFDLDEYVFAALQAGASGFLLKDATPEELTAGVRAAHAGDALLAPAVTRRLIESFVRPQLANPRRGDALSVLTAREREVLELLGAGLSNAEIAAQLFVAEATVKTHVGSLFAKLDVRDRAQAVVFAYESGLLARGRPNPD
jgi:DNA-binding NarL/FixJ family response regulator